MYINDPQDISILVVEDEGLIAEELRERLMDIGFVVCGIASRGEEAIAMAKEGRPDLILMDVRLRGGMDGIKAAELIKNELGIPSIFVTSHSDQVTVKRAQASRPFGYILKPFDFRTLEISIASALHRQNAEREREELLSSLKESETRYRNLLERMPDGILVTCEGRILYVNSALQELTGSTEKQLVGSDVSKKFAPKNVTQRADLMELLNGSRTHAIECAILHLDKSMLPVEIMSRPIEFQKRPCQLIVVRNLAYRKKIEGGRQWIEMRYAAILEYSYDAIIAIDKDQNLVIFNKSAERIFGHRAEKILGQPLSILLPLELSEIHQQHVNDFAKDPLLGREMNASRILQGRHKDGHIIPIISSISKIRLGDEILFTAIIKDQSQQQKVEVQLRHSQKMDVVGRLTAGVSHDLNNVLSGMLGYTELLRLSLSSNDPGQEFIKELGHCAGRAGRLARQLLVFSSKQAPVPERVCIHELINESREMYPRLLHEDIETRTQLNAAQCIVSIDRGQMEQVLLNLFINARDAMPEGGVLTVETQNIEFKEAQKNTWLSAPPGNYLALHIQDSGNGINKETLSKIFTPFFTTKSRGKGTGLGLSTVLEIIMHADGYLEIQTKPGEGTTFSVYLPSEYIRGQTDFIKTGGDITAKIGERVLLVEDDSMVRKLFEHILNMYGYLVFSASSGKEALKIIDEMDGHPNLLLSDIALPGMKGTELGATLRNRFPTMKTLFMSGQMQPEKDEFQSNRIPFFQKPIQPEKLGRKIREVLDA